MESTDAIYIAIGSRIRAARENVNLKQGQLASVVGLSRTSINNIESGRQKCMVHTLLYIAEACKVAPASLLGEQEATHVPNDLQEWFKRVELNATSK